MSADYLIDTQYVLWLAASDERALWLRPFVTDPASTVTISAISLSEIAIKQSIGKLRADVPDLRRRAAAAGFQELHWTGNHAESLTQLPMHHKDPFDRMLIAQARAEGMTVITTDAAFAEYDVALLAR